MNVLIVESPGKVKAINKYLGADYKVLASFGHIRDLPSKDGSVKPDDDFAMTWDVDARAASKIKDIAAAMKGADKLILATDLTAGEAISWHPGSARVKLLRTCRRAVTLNAITKRRCWKRCPSAPDRPKELVDAYLARRALDYLFGFTLSRVVAQAAGRPLGRRVQSVALRLMVERERNRSLPAQEYWSIDTDPPQRQPLPGSQLNGKKIEKLTDNRPMPAAVAAIKARASVGSVRPNRSSAIPPALQDLHPAAGSQPQTGLQCQAHHAGGAGPL